MSIYTSFEKKREEVNDFTAVATETNMSFSLCGPGFCLRHGGDVRHGDGRDGDAGGASPASVPLAARWEEPRVCPDGVQPAQRQPHRIHHHRAGGSTQRPQVPAPPPPLPQTPLSSSPSDPSRPYLCRPRKKQLTSYFCSLCPQSWSQLTKAQYHLCQFALNRSFF